MQAYARPNPLLLPQAKKFFYRENCKHWRPPVCDKTLGSLLVVDLGLLLCHLGGLKPGMTGTRLQCCSPEAFVGPIQLPFAADPQHFLAHPICYASRNTPASQMCLRLERTALFLGLVSSNVPRFCTCFSLDYCSLVYGLYGSRPWDFLIWSLAIAVK